jgi:hypothetical protein
MMELQPETRLSGAEQAEAEERRLIPQVRGRLWKVHNMKVKGFDF